MEFLQADFTSGDADGDPVAARRLDQSPASEARELDLADERL
jgi:hypothetical protein